MNTDGYDAVVYDLDGTLVHLIVDWASVTRDVREVYLAADVDPPESNLWSLLASAPDVGLAAEVEATIAGHEREGARRSTRLAHADDLEKRAEYVPVGVCSLNCEAACRIALEEHALASAVDAVVGRDSVETRKPHPDPLLAVIDTLESVPSRTLFIGDSQRDEETANRAGTRFQYVDGR
ncbi:HAD family hydrolase [Natronosalvus rutilus]|uniref:HAD hydrolase-like protein n=1 Tax=Natronosalvus rutilus TaxID=2953753 RepID=A0A9E7N829_9EURY|nr:HAD hydrolase-like protein [Natronosalvus rutilus]UTF52611.1 HAD hydrolase-like protein [Natronosalvus rutilus]